MSRLPSRVFVQACKSPPSFFVVESTVPGRAIELRDVLTGGHFQVLEQSASRTLRAGDLTYTRVVTAGGASIVIGGSPWVIPPAWHLRVLDFRQQLRPLLSDFAQMAERGPSAGRPDVETLRRVLGLG